MKLRGHDRETLWIAVAGSENSPREARAAFRAPDSTSPAQARPRSWRRAARWRATRASTCRATRRSQQSMDWGKQNLADLTQTATDVDLRWTDRARQWTPTAPCDEMTLDRRGLPGLPVAVRRRRRVHGARGAWRSASSRRSRTTCAPCATSPSSSAAARASSSTRWSPTARSGTARTTAPRTRTRASVTYDFNTDEIVKFPAAVALIWRWTGDDRFRDEMLDFTRRGLEYVRTRLDADGDGWPEGNGNVERPGMGDEKLDNAVYYIRGLYDYADMARSAGQARERRRRGGPRRRPRRPLRGHVVDRGGAGLRATRSTEPGDAKSTRSTGSAPPRWRPS